MVRGIEKEIIIWTHTHMDQTQHTRQVHPAKGPESYKRKALTMGISLHGGSVGQSGMGPSTRDFDIWLKGALRVEFLSMGAMCKEPRGRAPTGDPEVYV